MDNKTRNTAVYIILRFLVIVTIVFQILDKNWSNVFSSVVALLLFTIPTFVDDKLNIELPTLLESIIYMFIFSSQILGEIRNFYGLIPIWDTVLHTVNGFLFAGIGFSLVDLLNKKESSKLYLSPVYLSIVAVLFSVSVGTFWEFFEYAMDVYVQTDMQKDMVVNDLYTVNFNTTNTVESFNGITKSVISYGDGEYIEVDGLLDIGLHDTMKDMFVNLVGALVFAFFGYFYEVDSNNYEFVKHFRPKKKRK